MVKIIKEFNGLSGSKTYLKQENNFLYVEKIDNISRNIERYAQLEKNKLSIPKIYSFDSNSYTMEYIHGETIKDYLIYQDINILIDFLLKTFKIFSKNVIEKNYENVYNKKLENIDWYFFPFNKDDLIDKLPKNLPSGLYHGDFTLDNILFQSSTNKFILIDPLTSEYDSYIFDLAKLNQDLKCCWFIRNDKINLSSILQKIYDELYNEFNIIGNDYLLILMLLRVYPYCKNINDRSFIINEVIKLWK